MSTVLLLSLLVGGGGKIDWQRGAKEAPLQAALQTAQKSGVVVLVYFTADW